MITEYEMLIIVCNNDCKNGLRNIWLKKETKKHHKVLFFLQLSKIYSYVIFVKILSKTQRNV